MEYISFGRGEDILIILPGLGDGLRTVKGTGMILKRMYKIFANRYRVYIFSRKNDIEEGYSIRDMAADQRSVMEDLGIKRAHIMGISQGGMISQYIAIDYPEVVDRLVLALSVSRQNDIMQDAIQGWINFAEKGDYKNLIIDTMEKTYTEERLERYRKFYPLVSRVAKPKNFNRFIIQANACLEHDAYDELHKIKCPTLIIGGDSDQIVGREASREMSERIDDSRLVLYKGLGHGTYEEAEDFNQQILEFLTS